MYLDASDTTPTIGGKYIRQKSLPSAIREAGKMLDTVSEGQIGIYDDGAGNGFKGYVIKYAGQSPYFEAAL